MDPQPAKASNQELQPPARAESRATPESIIAIETLEELQLIARITGGAFGMQVKIGEAGQGSYFDTVNKTITLDPIHVREKPGFAKFVAMHEGAHAAITKSAEELGLTPEEIEALYSQIGFGFIHNITEDGAVNDWAVRTLPGMEKDLHSAYKDMFAQEGVTLSTPEVAEYARRLGRWPKFVQFGSEILRDWHRWRHEIGYNTDLQSQAVEGRFSKNLDPDVREALRAAIGAARQAISTIPEAGCRDQAEILQKHKERFKITTEHVFSEANKLVQIDFGIETARQALNDFGQMAKDLAKMKQDLKQAKATGDTQKAEQLKQEIRELEEQLKPFSDMDSKAREELKKVVKEAIEKSIRDFVDDIKKMTEQLKQSNERQEQLQKEIDSGQVDGKPLSGEELAKKKEELRQEQIKAEKLKKQIDQKINDALGDTQAAQDLKDAVEQTTGEQSPSQGGAGQGQGLGSAGLEKAVHDQMEQNQQASGESPLPYDELSQPTKDEINKMLNGMKDEHYKDASERARETLENFEDATNKEISSKLNESKGQTHEEQRQDAASQNQEGSEQSGDSSGKAEDSQTNTPSDPKIPTEAQIEKDADEFEKDLRKVEKARLGMQTDFERAMHEMHTDLHPVVVRIRKAWERNENPAPIKDQRQGKLNLRRGMASERDQRKVPTVFDKRQNPERENIVRIELYDRSGSMAGEKAEGAFHGAVFTGELNWRLKVPDAQYAFPGGIDGGDTFDPHTPAIELLKDFKESIRNPEVQRRVAGLRSTGGGTPDAEALEQVYEIIKLRREKYKIIDVISDSGSNESTSLAKVLKRIEKESKEKGYKVLVVHYGIGPGTTDVKGIYPISFGDLEVGHVGKARTFIEVYTRVNEELLQYPEQVLHDPRGYFAKKFKELME